jgi:hypothetical protein
VHVTQAPLLGSSGDVQVKQYVVAPEQLMHGLSHLIQSLDEAEVVVYPSGQLGVMFDMQVFEVESFSPEPQDVHFDVVS